MSSTNTDSDIPIKDLGFVSAFFFMLLDPKRTLTQLISYQGAPYGLRILIVLLLSLFVPILAQLYKQSILPNQLPKLTAVFIFIVFSILIFAVLEHLTLKVLKISAPPSVIFSCICYSLVPFIIFIWLFYISSYLTSGSIVVFDVLVAGKGELAGAIFRLRYIVLPLFGLITFFIICNCLTVISKISIFGTLTAAALSLLPALLSIFMALEIVDSGKSGSKEQVKQFFIDIYKISKASPKQF